MADKRSPSAANLNAELSPRTAARIRKDATSKLLINTAVLSDDDNSLLDIFTDDFVPQRLRNSMQNAAPAAPPPATKEDEDEEEDQKQAASEKATLRISEALSPEDLVRDLATAAAGVQMKTKSAAKPSKTPPLPNDASPNAKATQVVVAVEGSESSAEEEDEEESGSSEYESSEYENNSSGEVESSEYDSSEEEESSYEDDDDEESSSEGEKEAETQTKPVRKAISGKRSKESTQSTKDTVTKEAPQDDGAAKVAIAQETTKSLDETENPSSESGPIVEKSGVSSHCARKEPNDDDGDDASPSNSIDETSELVPEENGVEPSDEAQPKDGASGQPNVAESLEDAMSPSIPAETSSCKSDDNEEEESPSEQADATTEPPNDIDDYAVSPSPIIETTGDEIREKDDAKPSRREITAVNAPAVEPSSDTIEANNVEHQEDATTTPSSDALPAETAAVTKEDSSIMVQTSNATSERQNNANDEPQTDDTHASPTSNIKEEDGCETEARSEDATMPSAEPSPNTQEEEEQQQQQQQRTEEQTIERKIKEIAAAVKEVDHSEVNENDSRLSEGEESSGEESDSDEEGDEANESSEEEDEQDEEDEDEKDGQEQPKAAIPPNVESIDLAAEAKSIIPMEDGKQENEGELVEADKQEEGIMEQSKTANLSRAAEAKSNLSEKEKEGHVEADKQEEEMEQPRKAIPFNVESVAIAAEVKCNLSEVDKEKKSEEQQAKAGYGEEEEQEQPKAGSPSNVESIDIAAEADSDPVEEEEEGEEEYNDGEAETNEETETDKAEEEHEQLQTTIPANVESIEIAAEASSIPAEAFENCQQLKSVSFPPDSLVQSIGEAAFHMCSSLAEMHFPLHLEVIAREAFLGCVELRKVRFGSPGTLQRIERYAFYGCKSLLDLGLPAEFDQIERNALYGCFKLKVYPKNADPKVFVYTGEDDSQFAVPEDVTHARVGEMCECIPKKTFMYRHQLLQVDFRNATNLKTIEKHAFYRCDNLRDVNLSSTPVQSIGEKAFFGCKSLTSVHPPRTLTLVDGGALNFSGFYHYSGGAGEMVPADMKQVRVGTTVTNLPKEAFVQCEKLQEVVLTDALCLTSIGEEAFFYSEALTEISLSRNLRIIERAAFLGCSSLSKVSLNKNLEVIGDEAFESCTTLRSIAMSENVQVIGDSAFYSCSKLKQVRLNDLLRTIGQEAFMYCKSLANITLPSSLNTLGENAFEQCLSLEWIDLSGPDNLPLAMHIRVQYEDQLGEKLKMGSLVEMYSEAPLDASKLMSGNEEELQLLEEIKSAYLLVELDSMTKNPNKTKENGFVQFLSHHLDNQSAESLYDYLQEASIETVQRLANAKDFSGNSALNVAKPPVLQAFQERLSFLGRYNLQEEPIVFKSDNAIVVEALDYEMEEFYAEGFDRWSLAESLDGELFCRALEDLLLIPMENSFARSKEYFRQVDHANQGEISKEQFLSFCTEQFGRKVVLKFMQHEDQYHRELDRNALDLDRKHVLRILRHHDKRDTPGMADSLPDFLGAHLRDDESPSDYCHLIVLPYCDRNLEAIYRFEKPDELEVKSLLQEVAKALFHLHDNELVHGNLRMSKIVRQNGHVKLADMSASAKIGSEPLGLKVSSGVLPPEMIHSFLNSSDCEQLEDYYRNANAKVKESRAPKISDMPTKLWCVVRSYLTVKDRKGSTFIPKTEGLPYELLPASSSVDAWSFGILVYACCTGHTLLKVSYRDSIEDGNALRMLWEWNDLDLESSLAQYVEDDATKDLLRSLLRREPSMRPSMKEVLRHPFFDLDSKMGDWQSTSTAPTPHHDYVTVLNDELETPHISNKRSASSQKLNRALIPSGSVENEETVSCLQCNEVHEEVDNLKAELKMPMVASSSKGEDESVSLTEYKRLSNEVALLRDELKKSRTETRNKMSPSQELNRRDPLQYRGDLQDAEVVFEGWLQKRRFNKRSLWKTRYFVSYKDGTVTYFRNASDLNDPRNGGCAFHMVRFQKPHEGSQDIFELHTKQGELILQLRLSDLTICTADEWFGAKQRENDSIVHEGWLQKQSRKHNQLWNDRYFILNKIGTVMYYRSAAAAKNPSSGGATFKRVKWEHVADTSKKEDFDMKTINGELIMKLRLTPLSSSTTDDWMKGNKWFDNPAKGPKKTRKENMIDDALPSINGSAPQDFVYANDLRTFSGVSEMGITYDEGRWIDRDTGNVIESMPGDEDTWAELNDRKIGDEIGDELPAEEENELVQKKSDDAVVLAMLDESNVVAEDQPKDSSTANSDQPIEENESRKTPNDSTTTSGFLEKEDDDDAPNNDDTISNETVDLMEPVEEGSEIVGEPKDSNAILEKQLNDTSQNNAVVPVEGGIEIKGEAKEEKPENGASPTRAAAPVEEGIEIKGEPKDYDAIQEKQEKDASPGTAAAPIKEGIEIKPNDSNHIQEKQVNYTSQTSAGKDDKDECEGQETEAVQAPQDEPEIGDTLKDKDITSSITKAFQLFKRKAGKPKVNGTNNFGQSGTANPTITEDQDVTYDYDSVVSKSTKPNPNQIFAPVSAVNFAGEVASPSRSEDDNSLSVKSHPTEKKPNGQNVVRRFSEKIPSIVSRVTDRLTSEGKARRKRRREKMKRKKRLKTYDSEGVQAGSSL